MVNINKTISTTELWNLLNQIPDPDIPAISIVELGIIRNIDLINNEKVVVTITPSYSGCPAMNVFKDEIVASIKKRGINDVEIKINHSPAWTTDWLADSTKEKLRKYGIAPPEHSKNTSNELFTKQKVKCPHCNKENTKLTSQFGSTPCKALWFCNDCMQPFEYFKCY